MVVTGNKKLVCHVLYLAGFPVLKYVLRLLVMIPLTISIYRLYIIIRPDHSAFPSATLPRHTSSSFLVSPPS